MSFFLKSALMILTLVSMSTPPRVLAMPDRSNRQVNMEVEFDNHFFIGCKRGPPPGQDHRMAAKSREGRRFYQLEPEREDYYRCSMCWWKHADLYGEGDFVVYDENIGKHCTTKPTDTGPSCNWRVTTTNVSLAENPDISYPWNEVRHPLGR